MCDMTKGAPLGHLFLYAVPLLRCWPRGGLPGIAFACAFGWCVMLAFEVPYYFWTCREWKLPKASPSGLRPQACVEAQPPEAALSAETEAVRVS